MAQELSGPRAPPRVLLLGPYPPPWGGVQTNVVALRDFLRRRGIPCAVVNLTRHRREDGDDVYYPASAREVLRLIVRLRCEVIHLHVGGDLSPRLLALGGICSLLPGTRVVLTFHSGGYPASPEGRRARSLSLRGLALRRFHRLIAVNRELADLFRRFGCAPERVRLIAPHAFTPGLLQEIQAAPQPWQICEFAHEHARLLVTLSGLEPEYDIPLQLRALGMVRRTHPDAGLVVIGSGSAEAEIRKTIADTPEAGHVLLAGDLARPTALRVVASADLFLRTTWYDGDSISVREALWLGTPAIATDNGMRPPGVTLVPVGDAPALADAIVRQLAAPRGAPPDPAAHAEEHLEATLQLYEEMLAERRAS